MKKRCFFLSHCITKRKNLWEEIKAETAGRKIPLITHEVVYCNAILQVRHGATIVKREITKQVNVPSL